MKSKAKPTASPGTAGLQRNPRQLLRTALIVTVYLITFTILDLITKQYEELRGVVAWYPPVGITYTLLLVFGVRYAPAVTIALIISSLFIYRMPQPAYLLFLWAIIISLIYTGAAAFLRKRIRLDLQLQKLRSVIWLVFTAVIASVLLAILSVSSSALSSDMPRSEILHAIFLWWIGETVGVLTVTPFLLIHGMPWLKQFAEGKLVRLPTRRSFPRPTLSAIGQTASIALMLYWVFGVRVMDEYQPMYLITLPLFWIALKSGLKGVSAGIVALNSGVVLAMWLFRFNLARLGELELLIIVTCTVGLLMGAVVSERKRAEEQIRAMNAELEQRVEERTRELREAQEQLIQQERLAVLGRLASGVSHELRNPLGVILNAVYYLRLVQPEVNDKIKQYHSMIEQEAHNAEKIVNDLLDFARIKQASREWVVVSDLLDQTLARHPAPESVEVRLDLPTDLPKVFVDPHQMEQVLGNLIVNACQAMPGGGQLSVIGKQLSVVSKQSVKTDPLMTLQPHSGQAENWILITIKDTGVGIPPENMQKIFEPLFTTKAKSIGLGLAVSQKLVEANGGRIEVESEVGLGSTFTLVLPENK